MISARPESSRPVPVRGGGGGGGSLGRGGRRRLGRGCRIGAQQAAARKPRRESAHRVEVRRKLGPRPLRVRSHSIVIPLFVLQRLVSQGSDRRHVYTARNVPAYCNSRLAYAGRSGRDSSRDFSLSPRAHARVRGSPLGTSSPSARTWGMRQGDVDCTEKARIMRVTTRPFAMSLSSCGRAQIERGGGSACGHGCRRWGGLLSAERGCGGCRRSAGAGVR